MDKNNYCIILAGGIGSKLWPMSTGAKPKQFLDLFATGRSMLQLTYDRYSRLVPKENIFISTYKEYADISLTEMMDRIIAGETVYPDMPPNPKFGESVKVDLSERELDVLRELTMNRTNEEIARDLNLSPSTVKHHIEHMLEKTGYKNRIDLAVNAKSLAVVVHDEDRTGSSGRASGPQIPDEA